MTANYSASWFTFVDQTSLPKVRVSLTITGVNATSWLVNTQGDLGYWVGIGFGAQVMGTTDIVLCEFHYTGNPAVDQFQCTDRQSVGYSEPIFDTNNIVNVNTVVSYTTSGSDTLATLTAVFDRLLDTTLPNDFKLSFG